MEQKLIQPNMRHVWACNARAFFHPDGRVRRVVTTAIRMTAAGILMYSTVIGFFVLIAQVMSIGDAPRVRTITEAALLLEAVEQAFVKVSETAGFIAAIAVVLTGLTAVFAPTPTYLRRAIVLSDPKAATSERCGMFASSRKEVMVSETDIEAALIHLRSLPHRAPMPRSWDRVRLLNRLREAIGPHPSVDQCYRIGPGLFALVMPFGIDLASYGEPDHRLQVWLLIRPCGTDPTRTTQL